LLHAIAGNGPAWVSIFLTRIENSCAGAENQRAFSEEVVSKAEVRLYFTLASSDA
jgi:hypothetical protein